MLSFFKNFLFRRARSAIFSLFVALSAPYLCGVSYNPHLWWDHFKADLSEVSFRSKEADLQQSIPFWNEKIYKTDFASRWTVRHATIDHIEPGPGRGYTVVFVMPHTAGEDPWDIRGVRSDLLAHECPSHSTMLSSGKVIYYNFRGSDGYDFHTEKIDRSGCEAAGINLDHHNLMAALLANTGEQAKKEPQPCENDRGEESFVCSIKNALARKIQEMKSWSKVLR